MIAYLIDAAIKEYVKEMCYTEGKAKYPANIKITEENHIYSNSNSNNPKEATEKIRFKKVWRLKNLNNF